MRYTTTKRTGLILMSKTKKKSNDKQIICVLDMKFTILEEFILKVIQEKNGCSDKDIVEALCLKKKDIIYILTNDNLKKYVEGDDSRRTIISDFTKKEFLCWSNEEHLSDKKTYCNEAHLTFLKKFDTVDNPINKVKINVCYKLNEEDIVKFKKIT